MWCFQFLDYLHFLKSHLKKSQAIVFSKCKIFACDQLRTFNQKVFLPYRQDNYIYLVKNIIIIELLILGMTFFQHGGHNIMTISCNAPYAPFITRVSIPSKCWLLIQLLIKELNKKCSFTNLDKGIGDQKVLIQVSILEQIFLKYQHHS